VHLPRDTGRLPAVLAPLTAEKRWVIWKWEINAKTGKKTKVPYQAKRPGTKAKSTDPATGSDYPTAVAAAAQADGIGFCLLGSGIAAFDLDNCRNPETGELHPWAAAFVTRASSYTEITISGGGLRIIGFGSGGKIHRKQAVVGDVSLESYRQAERYIVMTGNVLPGSPAVLANLDTVMDQVVEELDAAAGGPRLDHPQDEIDEIDDIIKNGCGERYGGDRSRALWRVVNELLARGMAPNNIEKILLDESNALSEHVYDQTDPLSYVDRQISKAKRELDFNRDEHGKVLRSDRNIRIALLKLGLTFRRDEFADRKLIEGLKDFPPDFSDDALLWIWFMIKRQFRLDVSKDLLWDVISNITLINKFHPVVDYLAALHWDGISRLDGWLTTYGGVEKSDYTVAVGKLMLVAAVRRVRAPGCKFDEMVVFEHPEQGTEKSTILSVLAVNEDWFSDHLPLHGDAQKSMEAMRGRWIIEAAELSGMRKADVEHLKGFLSRQVDRARMAYDRVVSNVPRHCIIVGTTNSEEYLRDTTGNRRFWPVRCQRFDVAALKRDRDQLWAEAATVEATGVPIRLDPKLWSAAGEEQRKRLTVDPYFEMLEDALGDIKQSAKIAMGNICDALQIRPGDRNQEQSRRVGEAMRQLGWKRPNAAGTVKINGRNVSGFVNSHKRPSRNVQIKTTVDQGLVGNFVDESVILTTEQRITVRKNVLASGNVPRATDVNNVSVGNTVPTSMSVVAVPSTLIEINQEWRGHMCFAFDDKIIIVDSDHRIVGVITV
jgi:predicted P-loop ATPase